MRQRKDPTRKAAKNLGNVKIEATASDGAENASDHFVTSFLVFWGIEKAELRKKLRLGYINRNDVQDNSLFVKEQIV